jgi:hypothetical protein
MTQTGDRPADGSSVETTKAAYFLAARQLARAVSRFRSTSQRRVTPSQRYGVCAAGGLIALAAVFGLQGRGDNTPAAKAADLPVASTIAVVNPALFVDGFETGDLSQWTSATRMNVQSSEVASGSYAARATTTGAAAFAQKSLAASQLELHYRIRFKVLSRSTTVVLQSLLTAQGKSIVATLLNANGLLSIRNGVTGAQTTSTTPVANGVWHTLELHVRIAGPSSRSEVWYDGAFVSALAKTHDLGLAAVGRVQLGDNVSGRSYDIAYDDVAVEREYQAVDASAALGFGQKVETWTACEADFVGEDGLRDVVVMHHDARVPGGPRNLPGAELFQNTGSSYRVVFSWSRFSPQGKVPDRHDCVPGDWNADGRMDVYFTAGRSGANAVKEGQANELWIQEAPNVWRDRAAAWGVEDVCGRSHHAARVDANLDGLPDLFVGNAEPRDDPNDPCNAIPGSEESHLYLNVGGESMVDATHDYGLAGEGGVNCASAPDYDQDGARDLVVCRARGLLVLRNDGGQRFVDQREALGIPATNFADSEVADVTSDGVLDLVTATGTAVQVRSGVSGAPRTIYSTSYGQRIALGDGTGDGRRDVYVLRSNLASRTNPQDVILVNTGTGWSPALVPNASGIGDFAVFLEELEGYLVGNGREDSTGELQAITIR